jgi:hypothetical protein
MMERFNQTAVLAAFARHFNKPARLFRETGA